MSLLQLQEQKDEMKKSYNYYVQRIKNLETIIKNMNNKLAGEHARINKANDKTSSCLQSGLKGVDTSATAGDIACLKEADISTEYYMVGTKQDLRKEIEFCERQRNSLLSDMINIDILIRDQHKSNQEGVMA